MATFQLRLTGITAPHVIASVMSAYPATYIGYQVFVRGVNLGPGAALTEAAAIGVALLPWMSRTIARRLYRAKCDDIAVHVRGEALPYRAITSVERVRTWRRDMLILHRGETVAFHLILRDAFAGRLEPLDELARRLDAHGKSIPAT